MRLNRVFCEGPLASGAELDLPAAGAYHIVRVLRLREGAPLAVFDGKGAEFHAEISRLDKRKVTLRLLERISRISESMLNITLVQGVSRGDRMDWTLQKATELGVTAIVPVLSARSVVRLDEEQMRKKQAHWRGIIIGAAEQSGRTRIPALAPSMRLRDYLIQSRKSGLRIVLSPSARTSLASLGNQPNQVELLIGPEGGLDDEETMAAQRAGFRPVHLGPRVLRTETASVVTLSILQALWGDLR
ncbi:16S rRNA (uracil1498-N3)-methyltransferase [Steroidobacter denitrificans]|uniref:Ribosomal RNA small subunit methyltransferase E n=1 Tax=Steroidobacter denitrificans TaxID=465721 RepID=A0A127F858_STEDE|nr:16S rRNA (uracil(1498)-N(3))-methyltransferase [Steroidobacter denitrificans]AMN45798.1 16S rRNA (uracil1498-N3)-methyltransferase [Steroidobacter denitrificans]